jgi:hypothetical protein
MMLMAGQVSEIFLGTYEVQRSLTGGSELYTQLT